MLQSMPALKPRSILDEVTALVLRAGAMIRADFHRPGGPRKIRSDKAPVDVEVEEMLRDGLLALHRCNWHAEELGGQDIGHRDTWAVDPQDGTSAFIRGHRGSSISVALLREGRPVLAVVFAPTAPDDAGDLFTWADGVSPRRNGRELPRLEAAAYSAATVIAINERAGDYAKINHEAFAPAGILAVPSIAYRLALVAAGEVDATLSLTGGLDTYDVAAGEALVLAVGGKVSDRNGRLLDHAGSGSFDGCVSGRPGVASEMVRRLGRLADAPAEPRRAARPRAPVADMGILARAQGALLGQFAGDALGAQVEFRDPLHIRREYPDGVTEMRPGGTWDLLAGQITDDSEMALALARSLVAEAAYVPQKAGAAYLAWGASKPFDVGTTTREGLDAIAGRGTPNATSQSNGALMRVVPIGIAAQDWNRASAWARKDAELTHPHPGCQAANGAFAAAVSAGISGASPREMWETACEFSWGSDEVRATLEAARTSGPRDATRSQGWVLIALQNAFHRLLAEQPLEQALIDTVMMGGDTDTNAAICGALLGAAQGRDAVPLRWRRAILGCRAVAGKGVRHPRPSTYWTDDTLDLAEALAALRPEVSRIQA